MTDKSPAAIIAAALSRAEKAETELQHLIRWLNDLATTTEKTTLDFHDDDLSVDWTGGGCQFRQGAYAPFTMLQALYNAEGMRLSHAEIADIVYADDCAPIRDCARSLREKLDKSRCPLKLEHDSSAYWLTEE